MRSNGGCLVILVTCFVCFPIDLFRLCLWDWDIGQLVSLHFLLRQEQGVKLTLIRPSTVYVALSKSPNEAEHGIA